MPWCPKCGMEMPTLGSVCQSCSDEPAAAPVAKLWRAEALGVAKVSVLATIAAVFAASMLSCMCDNPFNDARFLLYPVLTAAISGFLHGRATRGTPRASAIWAGWLPGSLLMSTCSLAYGMPWAAAGVAWGMICIPSAFAISASHGARFIAGGAWKQWLWLVTFLALILVSYTITTALYAARYNCHLELP